MNDIELTITGMTCEHCVRAVAQALEGVPGVSKAEVTLKPGKAIVYGQTNATVLIAAVEKEGYQAEVQG